RGQDRDGEPRPREATYCSQTAGRLAPAPCQISSGISELGRAAGFGAGRGCAGATGLAGRTGAERGATIAGVACMGAGAGLLAGAWGGAAGTSFFMAASSLLAVGAADATGGDGNSSADAAAGGWRGSDAGPTAGTAGGARSAAGSGSGGWACRS